MGENDEQDRWPSDGGRGVADDCDDDDDDDGDDDGDFDEDLDSPRSSSSFDDDDDDDDDDGSSGDFDRGRDRDDGNDDCDHDECDKRDGRGRYDDRCDDDDDRDCARGGGHCTLVLALSALLAALLVVLSRQLIAMQAFSPRFHSEPASERAGRRTIPMESFSTPPPPPTGVGGSIGGNGGGIGAEHLPSEMKRAEYDAYDDATLPRRTRTPVPPDRTDGDGDDPDGDDRRRGGLPPPPPPPRIYRHATLSAKNYRGGGALSDEMLRNYEEDGVIVVRNLIPPGLLDRLDGASASLVRRHQQEEEGGGTKKRTGKQFHMVKNGAIFLGVDVPPGGSNVTAGEDDGEEGVDAGIMSSFRDLAVRSMIPRVAASLLRLDELRAGDPERLMHHSRGDRRRRAGRRSGGEGREEDGDVAGDDSVNLRICRDIFLTKDDDPYACGWHVDDTGFWPAIASDPGVNAWVALDDMPLRSSGGAAASTFALAVGSHRAPWRHDAYLVTGSTHTLPSEGFASAFDLVARRAGHGTCNVQTSAPDLYERLERRKRIYDVRRGDVIFHDRWVFHRTVTVDEHRRSLFGFSAGDADGENDVSGSGRSSSGSSGSTLPVEDRRTVHLVEGINVADAEPESDGGCEGEEGTPSSALPQIFRRYSIRYSPGTARVPPGYGVELSVLHDPDHANRTLDDIVRIGGLPWYPKAWPNVEKDYRKRQEKAAADDGDDGNKEACGDDGGSEAGENCLDNGDVVGENGDDSDEMEGIFELVHRAIPAAEARQRERKREIRKELAAASGRQQRQQRPQQRRAAEPHQYEL